MTGHLIGLVGRKRTGKLVCRFFGHNPEIVKKLYGFTDAHCRRCGRVGIGVLA